MAFDVDLTELSGDFEDVRVEDPTEYPDQTDPAPITPGIYRWKVDEADMKKDKDGHIVESNGYPQIQLNKLTVVEPAEFAGRTVYAFQSFSLQPIGGGPREGATPAVDLLRAFDDSLPVSNGKEVIQRVAEMVNNGQTFVAGTNWVAKDSTYIKDTLDDAGGFDAMEPDARKQLFKAAIIRGQNKFPKVNGYPVPRIEGPSGDILQARAQLTRLYPASEDVELGPYKSKRASKDAE